MYHTSSDQDILETLAPLFMSKALYLRGDGKIAQDIGRSWDSPWVFTNYHHELKCEFWNDILYKRFKIIPMGCLSCYKIVVKPRTLEELFKLREIQVELGHYAKCGIEVRAYTFGNYGGYFYTRSLEEGRKRYAEVRAAVDAGISSDVKVYLKRGCTEYEFPVDKGGKGPSDKWEPAPDQANFESYIADKFVHDSFLAMPPEYININIYRRWIRHAYDRGDETYALYVEDDRPLYEPPVLYHEEKQDE